MSLASCNAASCSNKQPTPGKDVNKKIGKNEAAKDRNGHVTQSGLSAFGWLAGR